jgi:putative chitobiose transport system permease protein
MRYRDPVLRQKAEVKGLADLAMHLIYSLKNFNFFYSLRDSNPTMSSRQSLSKNLLIYGGLSIIAILMLFPLLWLVGTALKSPEEDIFGSFWRWLPQKPTLDNFGKVWQAYPFWRYLINSTIIAVLTVGLNVFFCSLAAYPLARFQFRGKDWLFAGIVSTIMIPFQIVMIPLYILTVQLGLRNSYLGVIFPGLASAFGIFLLRQAFQSVPKELEEAAQIDGCSALGTWWHIMLPAIRPAIVTLAIFVFIGSWSDFLWPLIVLDRQDFFTLPLGVAKLASSLDLDWRLIAAGSLISIAPVLLVFVALQRFILPTETGAGVKG